MPTPSTAAADTAIDMATNSWKSAAQILMDVMFKAVVFIRVPGRGARAEYYSVSRGNLKTSFTTPSR